MTATTIRVQMAQRKDTAANWTSANPILLSGEIGYETDTKKFKIGNGSTNWNSLAYLPIPDGSGNLTITGNLEIGSTGSLTFEGSTADGFETTLAVTNPTGDRTITLPDRSGTVITSGDTGTITSTMLADGTIVNDDVNVAAAIAGTKISPDFGSQTVQTTGIFSHALGSAAAPTVTFTGDTNTGIYSPGADQVAISTGGSGRLFVDASGRVGVGTSSPAHDLDVLKTASGSTTTARIGATATTGANNATLILNNGGTGNATLRFDYEGSTNRASIGVLASDQKLTFGTAGSTAMTIDASQRLGIGTTSPTALLTVNGTGVHARFQSGAASDGRVEFAYNTTDVGFISATDANTFSLWARSGNALSLGAGGLERARLDSSGRLLVGTSSSYGVGSSAQAKFQASDTTATIHASFTDWSSADSGGIIVLGKAKGGSAGNYTIVANGNTLGEIRFAGADGTDLETNGASIRAEVDGTPGANDMPGRLVFSTTADGASSPTERMRINSAGDIGMSSGLTLGNINPSLAGFYSTTAILGTGAGTNAVKFNTSSGKFTYDTSSRLNKDQIEDCPYGIAEIKLLQPRRYYRIDDQRLEVGFVADEVFDVLPEFVPFGPKSAITGNENDTESIPLGVNYEKLTAVLTAALQEAIGEIETLKARLTAAGI